MEVGEARQLVINAMDVDRARRTGLKGVQHKIAFDTGTHLTRYFRHSTITGPLITPGLQRFCVVCDA